MSTSIFLFGTLLDTDIIELVCQTSINKLKRRSATLPGFEPRYVVDQPFPVLVLAPQSITAGEVVDFDDIQMERLNHCEAQNFELYDVSVKLDTGTDYQCAYYSNIGFEKISDRRWILEEFQQIHKESFLKRLKTSHTAY